MAKTRSNFRCRLVLGGARSDLREQKCFVVSVRADLAYGVWQCKMRSSSGFTLFTSCDLRRHFDRHQRLDMDKLPVFFCRLVADCSRSKKRFSQNYCRLPVLVWYVSLYSFMCSCFTCVCLFGCRVFSCALRAFSCLSARASESRLLHVDGAAPLQLRLKPSTYCQSQDFNYNLVENMTTSHTSARYMHGLHY